MNAEQRLPVEFYKRRFVLRVQESKSMNAEALHHSIRTWDRTIGHQPHDHVGRLRHQRDEIPESIMGRRGLRHFMMRLGLDGVYEIRKLRRVLYKKDRHVITDEIEISLVGIELNRESTHVPRKIRRTPRPSNRREPYKHRRFTFRVLEEGGLRNFRHRLVYLKYAVCTGPSGVDDPLRYALVIKMRDLLAHDEILEQRRTTVARF